MSTEWVTYESKELDLETSENIKLLIYKNYLDKNRKGNWMWEKLKVYESLRDSKISNNDTIKVFPKINTQAANGWYADEYCKNLRCKQHGFAPRVAPFADQNIPKYANLCQGSKWWKA